MLSDNLKSIFNAKDEDIISNIDTMKKDEMMKKANLIYKQHCTLFNIEDDVVIKPLNKYFIEKKKAKEARGETAGKDWFYMPKGEVTPEVENDLKAIKLRKFMDPKRFYKDNDTNKLPKYFQIGKIIEGSTDFQDKRLTRKERKGTIAQQFHRSDSNIAYSKRKFEEVQDKKRKIGLRKSELKRKQKLNYRKNKK